MRPSSAVKPAPDFVIVGGAKCGTTSLYSALKNHPEIFLSVIKEPHFFDTEKGKHRATETLESYAELFDSAGETQIRGEASVGYLGSDTAIPSLLRYRPDAKVIVMVRNPVDMFVSWHNSCMISCDEDEPDAEKAWRLQSARMAGRNIPKWCSDPRSIQYRKFCSLGSQLKRVYELVPASQLLVVVLEDLRNYPVETCGRVMDFLGVARNPEVLVQKENSFSRPRNHAVALLGQALKVWPPLKWIRVSLKGILNPLGIYYFESLFRANLVASARPELSPAFREELGMVFEEEISLLETLLKRDFSEWRGYGKASPLAQAV